MIFEKPLANINDYQIKIKKNPIPQSSNKSLPALFNTQLYIGSKGRGKSYSLVKLLNMYENSIISDFFKLFFSQLLFDIDVTSEYIVNINVKNLANNILVFDGNTYVMFNNGEGTIQTITIEEIIDTVFTYIPEFMVFMRISFYSGENLLYTCFLKDESD